MTGFFQKNKHLAVIFFLAFVNIFIWSAVSAEDRNGYLTVAFLDVGQGDSIFIESPTGAQMVIDGGPNRKVLSELSKVMSFFDRTLDVVLATHPDKDHIAGLVDVLNHYEVKYVVMTAAFSETEVYQAFSDAVEKSGAAVIRPRRGLAIDLGAGVEYRVLFPDRDLNSVSDSNTGSVVGLIDFDEIEFLLSGDAPDLIEKYLISLDAEILASEVLKAGHHGSKTSSTMEFVAAVSPDYGVISVGKDNRYGHPDNEVLDNFNAVGAEIFRTDEQGTVVFKTDGQILDVLTP